MILLKKFSNYLIVFLSFKDQYSIVLINFTFVYLCLSEKDKYSTD